MSKSNIKLLVLDDEPAILQVLVESFRYEGWQIGRASTYEEAEICARASIFDALLLDIYLEGPKSGIVFGRRYKQQFPNTRIYLITGKELPAEGVPEGWYVFKKPIDSNEIIKKIKDDFDLDDTKAIAPPVIDPRAASIQQHSSQIAALNLKNITFEADLKQTKASLTSLSTTVSSISTKLNHIYETLIGSPDKPAGILGKFNLMWWGCATISAASISAFSIWLIVKLIKYLS